MTRTQSFLLLLVLGFFFTSSLICGQEKEGTQPTKASENKEDPEKKDDSEDKKEEKPPKIGNFALPNSQQPSSLFGFGGNIIDKGEVQLYFFADDFKGRHKTAIELIPGFLYGIADNFSIFLTFPVTPILKDQNSRSEGLQDFFAQFEYAFYNKSTSFYVDQATVLANITAPTGSSKKNPPTGFGAPSFFLGATYSRVFVDWFVSAAPGTVLTNTYQTTKIGDQFLYQFCIGRNFPSPEGWIYAWMMEIDGQYNKRDRIRGMTNFDSGGNVVYATPSLWISSKDFLFQFGVSFPVAQNLLGNQRKVNYVLNLNVAWSFY